MIAKTSDDRSQSRSTIVASQPPLEFWHESLADPSVADAILDRLVHNAHELLLKGDSMRKVREAILPYTTEEPGSSS